MARPKRNLKLKSTPELVEYDRMIHQVLNMIARKGITFKEIVEKTGFKITIQTLRNWQKGPAWGGTRHPAYFRLELVAKACGFRNAGWIDESIAKPTINDLFHDVSEPVGFNLPPDRRRPRKPEKTVPTRTKAVKGIRGRRPKAKKVNFKVIAGGKAA